MSIKLSSEKGQIPTALHCRSTPMTEHIFSPTAPDRRQMYRSNLMNISIQSLDDITVVTIAGVADSKSAGKIYDALVAQLSAGAQTIVVEFTDTVILNRAGIRGLIVASKILQNRRGQMRICGAKPQDEQFLNSVSFRHLLTFDRDRAASIAAIAESGEAFVDGNHLPPPAKAA